MDKENEMQNDWNAVNYAFQFNIDYTTTCIYIEHGLN